MTTDPIFNEENKVRTSAIKWGKVGDWLKGTLVDNTREVPNTLSDKDEMQRIFEFKIHAGQFHNIVDRVVDEKPTVLEAGHFWSVYAKPGLAQQMRNLKIGQVVGLKFAKELDPKVKGYNKTKVIEVYPGAMDPDYKGEQAGDSMAAGVDEALED